MYVRRDYARSIYGARRGRSRVPLILLFGMLIVGFIVFVYSRFDQLQSQALEVIGMAPEPTLFPSDYATRAADKFVDGDLLGAEADYRRAVQQRPDNVDYLYEYGRVLIELDHTDEAARIGDQAIAAAPNDVRGFALKANALRWSSPGEAITIALQGEEISENFAPLYAALTIAYAEVGRYSLAIAAAEKGLSIDDRSAEVYRAYSWPLVLVDRSQEAVEMLEMATSITPNLPGPWFELASEYKNRLKQPKMAIAIYERIINEMNPSDDDLAKAYLRICETMASVEFAKFNVAERYCRQALEIKPEYGAAFKEQGRMQYNRRNYEGAIESFEKCVAFEANLSDEDKDLECWGLRGLAHYWMNECPQAWDVLNEALQLAEAQGKVDGLVEQINIGVGNVIEKCPDYKGVPTPTPIPPTPIPPTPIGGL